MFHRVKSVKPLNDYKLNVVFLDGTEKIYNVAALFDKWDIFDSLKNINGLFEQVKVDVGGYGIYWNDEIDLACNELWQNGIAAN